MVLGLKEIQIRGEIHTNVDYTIDLLHVSSCISLFKKKILGSPIYISFTILTYYLFRLRNTGTIRSTQVGWIAELLCV